jgi:hypothetical protein
MVLILLVASTLKIEAMHSFETSEDFTGLDCVTFQKIAIFGGIIDCMYKYNYNEQSTNHFY